MKNISKIISIIFLSFSILLLFYIYYRSQTPHGKMLINFYKPYYTIAFLLIFFSLISFFVPKNLKINITIIIISVFIGLYFVEWYLVKKNLNKFVAFEKNTNNVYDKRTPFQIFKDLKKNDPKIVPLIYPTTFEENNGLKYFSLSGLANRKTIHCNENGYYSIYQSDRFGFNNPNKEWDKETIELLLIGDSFAHGACVNEPNTISGNLRKLNKNINGVLNLGISGNGPLIELATLREYFLNGKVKKVLWIYIEHNDLFDIKNELKNEVLLSYLKDKNFSQNLMSKNSQIQKILLKKLEKQIEREEAVDLNKFIKLFLTRNKIILPLISKVFKSQSDSPADPKELKNILKLANEFTNKNNSKLYFVYLPRYGRYIQKSNNDDLFNYKKIIKIVNSLNIPLIDIHEDAFKKHNDPLSLFPFRKSGHYNEKGYELVAKTIFKTISELEK
jgi:hypothetical protein